MQPSDLDLVGRAKGDRTAFALLYRRYVDPVYRYCSRQLDPSTSEDLTSTVFLRAMAALDSFDPARAGFRAWLFTIAHHAIVDQLRSRTHLPIADYDRHDRDPSPEEQAVSADQRLRLRAALRHLPPEQQAVINLRLADLTGIEIATILHKSPGAVRVLQHRAVQTLKCLLAEPERS